MILLEINSINIPKLRLFCLWWYVMSDLSQSLSQAMNSLLYYLFLVQLQREVIKQLWSVPGEVRHLEEQTSDGVGIIGTRSSSGGCALLAVGGPWDTSITNTWLPCTAVQWLALVVLRNSTFCTLQWVLQFYASSPYLTSQGWHPPENTKADKCEKSYCMRFGRRVFSTSVKLKEVPGERKPAAAARIKRQLFEPNLIF